MNPETQACARTTEGSTCGTTTFSAYTACSYASQCASTGSRTRTRTDPVCASGTCSAVQTTETDTAGCNRTTDNTSCGASTYGAYGSCGYANSCSETGSRTRTRTDPVCQAGSCGSTNATETDTTGCSRSTSGQSCNTTNTGAWTACSYAATCSTSGSRTRQVTSSTCGSSACNSNTVTETDTTACTRSTSGTSCGTTVTSAWSSCSYADNCTNGGSRTRTVTTSTCNGSGSCNPSTVTETDTAGCARDTSGNTCAATTYGGYGSCSYGSTCANSGSRTRSMTTYTCNAGACAANAGTDTDTAGCGRTQDGASCGMTVTGAWSACSYGSMCTNSGSRSRSVTTYTCGGGTCGRGDSSETDTAGCARITDGLACGPISCGVCTSGCDCACQRVQNCNGQICSNQACVGTTFQQRCGTCTNCNICLRDEQGNPLESR